MRGGRLAATCFDVRHDILEGTYLEGDKEFSIEWRRWTIGFLRWSHFSGLLFLQGAPIRELANPFIVLSGTPRPAYHPEPGVEHAVLAEIFSTSEGISASDYERLFYLLVPEARGA